MNAGEDRLRRLEALRDRLTDAIVDAAHRDLAPLAARLQSVLQELAEGASTEEVSFLDKLTSRDELAPRRGRRSS